MKYNLLFAILFFSCTLNLSAQRSLSKFMHKYSHTRNADYVNVGRLAMLLVRPFLGNDDKDARFLKKIHKVEVLDFDANANKQSDVRLDVQQLKSDLTKDGYDELMFVKSEGDNVHILGKVENDDLVKDCVLLVDGSDEITLVHVIGRIRLSEIENLSGKWDIPKFSAAKN